MIKLVIQVYNDVIKIKFEGGHGMSINIAIQGNGVDLAHGLPTRYVDVMKTINTFYDAIYNSRVTNLSGFLREFRGSTIENYVRKYLSQRLGKSNTTSELVIQKLEPLFTAKRYNFWLIYFGAMVEQEREANSRGQSIASWLDCETETEEVLKTIDEALKNGKIGFGRKLTCEWKKEKKKLVQILNFLNQTGGRIENEGQLIQKLERDYRQFQNCVDLYIEYFINAAVRDGWIHSKIPEFMQIKFDKVITFNYSKIYKELYQANNSNVDIVYIHGKAGGSRTDAPNIVLGIGTYFEDECKCAKYMAFEKRWQRLMYETDRRYKDWIEKSEFYLYMYGYSCGIFDGDILRKLLLHKHNKGTTIYFLNYEAQEACIKNLIKILEPDVLGRKMENSEIRFVQTQEVLTV